LLTSQSDANPTTVKSVSVIDTARNNSYPSKQFDITTAENLGTTLNVSASNIIIQ